MSERALALVAALALSTAACSPVDREQRALIRDIVETPERIQDICASSSLELSPQLSEALGKFEEVYVEHFRAYGGRFEIAKRIEGKDAEGASAVSVWVVDEARRVSTEFQFMRKSEDWVLWNIVLPHPG